nr:MAG TPA: hypothetical protein [Caudoviricetes sp.]
MPGCTRLRLGAPARAAMAYTRHAGEGCAGRFATGRGVGRPDGLPNRPGLRVPATPSGRGTWGGKALRGPSRRTGGLPGRLRRTRWRGGGRRTG